MSQCKFEDKSSGTGMTLISTRGTCLKESGVYLPKPHYQGEKLDVLLWFHGFYVNDIPFLFAKDGTKVRDIVRASNKDLVVIAPHMGHVDYDLNGRDAFVQNCVNIGSGQACEKYLDQTLDAIAAAIGPRPRGPGQRMHEDTSSAFIDIDNLYIGCHSGGGTAMKTIVGGSSLGRYKSKLKQCWGFDCVYGLGGWEAAVRNRTDVDFYLYFGRGTSFEAGGSPIQLWNIVYGPKKAPNVYMAPGFAGVEDDRIAFQSVDDIKNKTSSVPYERIRKDVDRFLGDAKGYWKYVRKNYWLDMKDHYPVSTDLLGPRIAKALP